MMQEQAPWHSSLEMGIVPRSLRPTVQMFGTGFRGVIRDSTRAGESLPVGLRSGQTPNLAE